MTDEYEIYLPDMDASRALILYRGKEYIEPLYLDVKKLREGGIPVKTKGRAFNRKCETDKSEYYDEPIRLQEVKEPKGHQIEEVEEIEEENKQWYKGLDKHSYAIIGFVIGLVITFSLVSFFTIIAF